MSTLGLQAIASLGFLGQLGAIKSCSTNKPSTSECKMKNKKKSYSWEILSFKEKDEERETQQGFKSSWNILGRLMKILSVDCGGGHTIRCQLCQLEIIKLYYKGVDWLQFILQYI